MYWRCVLICVPGVLNFTVTKLAHFRRKPENFVLITSVQLQYIMSLPCTKYHYSFFLQWSISSLRCRPSPVRYSLSENHNNGYDALGYLLANLLRN
jgi:hypothetical protein